MILGWLQVRGLQISRAWLTESYARIHGAPAILSNRTIHRKVYNVAGANSLWYHNGQHGECHRQMNKEMSLDIKCHF